MRPADLVLKLLLEVAGSTALAHAGWAAGPGVWAVGPPWLCPL